MISVIIPTFNAEKTIKDCINSILKQKINEEIELIVVDDGSNDRTREILKSFGGKAKLIEQKHKGPAAARNNGAKNAKGEIILFTDSDCVVGENWVDEMSKPLKEKEAVGVQGSYKTEQKELIARFIQIEIEERYGKMKKEKYIDFIGSYSAAYWKAVFQEFGGFNESFSIASGEDPELSYRISEKGLKMVFNPGAIVYHTHPTSMLQYFKIKFFRGYWRVLLYRKHKEKAVKDSYTPQALKLQIGVFYLFFLLLISSILLMSELIFISGVFLGGLFVLMIPFIYFALKKDFIVGIISPIMLLIRTAAFSLGLIAGLFGGIKK
ncbi:MAG: glycosyltransferase [archaeon]